MDVEDQDFAVGDRVMTIDGYPGVIREVVEGVFGADRYVILLDNGMGGGDYSASEITEKISSRTAKVESRRTAARADAPLLDPDEAIAKGYNLASLDYPELAEILYERPDWVEAEDASNVLRLSAKTAVNGGWVARSFDGGQGWELRDTDGRDNFLVEVMQRDGTWIWILSSWDDGWSYGTDLDDGSGFSTADEAKVAASAALDRWKGRIAEFRAEFRSASKQADKYTSDDPIGESIRDKDQPWWWRKIVGPALDRVNQGLPPKDRVTDIHAIPGRQWCRFRRDGYCWFPDTLDERGTEEAGYAVWVPKNQGRCPRITHKAQKDCPVSEAGPDSGEALVYPDATIPWHEGGQRQNRSYAVKVELTRKKVAGWSPTSIQANTYPGLSETLVGYDYESAGGVGQVLLIPLRGEWLWVVQGRDGSSTEGYERNQAEAQRRVEEFVREHAELPGQLSLFGSKKLAAGKPVADMSKEEFEALKPRLLYHATNSREDLQTLLTQGVRMSNVPNNLARQRYRDGEYAEFAPGAGAGWGLYASGDPYTAGGFGRHMIAIEVSPGDYEIPPEARAMESGGVPYQMSWALKDANGVLITKDIPADKVHLVVEDYRNVVYDAWDAAQKAKVARRYSGTPIACDKCGASASVSQSGGKDGHTMLCEDCRKAKSQAVDEAGDKTAKVAMPEGTLIGDGSGIIGGRGNWRELEPGGWVMSDGISVCFAYDRGAMEPDMQARFDAKYPGKKFAWQRKFTASFAKQDSYEGTTSSLESAKEKAATAGQKDYDAARQKYDETMRRMMDRSTSQATASKDERFAEVGLKQDDDGWYVTTHRARSKSYPTPEDIPQDDVDFIASTGAKTAKIAKWADIVAKAKQIRSSGGVRVIAVTDNTITAEVRGHTSIYLTSLTREPGTKRVGLWECSCPWNTYAWDRSEPWKSLEGRMCSHALALRFEAQAQEMFGGQISERAETPEWRTSEPTFHQPDRVAAAQMAKAIIDQIEGIERTRTASVHTARSLRDVKVKVRNQIVRLFELLGGGMAEVEQYGVIPVRDITYPTTGDLYRGLSYQGSHTAVTDEEVAEAQEMLQGGFSYVEDPDDAADPIERFDEELTAEGSVHAAQYFDGANASDEANERYIELCNDGDYTHAGLIIKALDSGRVLMTQRTPYHGDGDETYGAWEFPGGSIEDGEEPWNAALREFTEETGLTLPDGWQINDCYRGANPSYLAFVVCVPNEAWTTNADMLPQETMGIGWFEPEQLQDSTLARPEIAETEWEIVAEAKVASGEMVCETCGGPLQKDFAGWGHVRKPDRPHRVKPVPAAEPADDEFMGDAEGEDGLTDFGRDLMDWAHRRSSALAERSAAVQPVDEKRSIMYDEPQPALPVSLGGEEEDAALLEGLPPDDPDDDPLVPGDPRLAWVMGDHTAASEEFDVAAAAEQFLAKEALKAYSPAEKAAIIDEGGTIGASNLTDLDLSGTHYQWDPNDDSFTWD